MQDAGTCGSALAEYGQTCAYGHQAESGREVWVRVEDGLEKALFFVSVGSGSRE